MGYWLAELTRETECRYNMKSIFCVISDILFVLLTRLTNTPRKTSGHGWTLVNVGLTMAIAILDEKWVRGEK